MFQESAEGPPPRYDQAETKRKKRKRRLDAHHLPCDSGVLGSQPAYLVLVDDTYMGAIHHVPFRQTRPKYGVQTLRPYWLSTDILYNTNLFLGTSCSYPTPQYTRDSDAQYAVKRSSVQGIPWYPRSIGAAPANHIIT